MVRANVTHFWDVVVLSLRRELRLDPEMRSRSCVARFRGRRGPPRVPSGVGDALAAALCIVWIKFLSKLQRETWYLISMANVASPRIVARRDPLDKNLYFEAFAQKCDDVEQKWLSHRRSAESH